MGIDIEVWSTIAEDNLFAKTPLITVADTKFEGELRKGNKVHVYTYPRGGVTVVDYDGDTGIDFDRVKPSTVEMLIDQAKAFGFRVDKMDLINNSTESTMKFLDNTLADVREGIDAYILNKAKSKITTNIVDNSTIKLDETNIVGIFEQVNTKLNDSNASNERFAYVDNTTLSMLRLAGLVEKLKFENDGSVGPKSVYKFGDNTTILSSSLIKGNGTTLEILFGTYDFINFVGKLEELESLKLEKFFGEAVKGLFVYGAEVFNEEKGAKLIVKDYTAL